MIKTMKEVLQINEADNVAVALKDYKAGDTIVIGSKEIKITEDIARALIKLHYPALAKVKTY